ncbi:MAG: hypothetical protein A2071_09040 [Bacteroidetes bacterium GWC1_47_7]|uniref:Uncharacterized protein n=1 Tax=Candidatus Woesebacteria bacterium GW2011_GWA1_41_13b TaxID=1618555 RepID=A0A0G0USF3_9BACT|nr:MAG: hypothetical protein UU42_C0008G0015 [Candidatus Woesebacteria bacterium GW2011_GWA1_41_13b]KKT74188.1 MAG: hypothetical protein UW69_C0045G0015 [Microgenomates group bacterium GW2011_GWA2_44_7]OFX75702.1 MAG: hypothetical protein A2071_09040 [Bacteroidetes bacterium GWC1_47_7]
MEKKLFKLLLIITLLLVTIFGLLFIKDRYLTKGVKVSVQPDYSPGRTIQEVGQNVSVNFSQCTSDVRRIDVAFGSTTIEIQGKEGVNCKLNYGGEVENPNWDGKLQNKCRIPANLGTLTFAKSGYGVDLSAIQRYCTN